MMSQMPDLLAAPPAVLRMEPLRMAMQEDVLAEDWTLLTGSSAAARGGRASRAHMALSGSPPIPD